MCGRSTTSGDLPALAYAHYVLARAKADDLGALRYFNDTQMARLPTQLAKAQLAAALAPYGDTTRAAAAYAAALVPPPRPAGVRYVDYGSDLRDSAARAGVCRRQSRQSAAADRRHRPDRRALRRADRTSTQEQAWLLMAAEAAAKAGGGTMTVAGDGGAPQTRQRAALFAPRCSAPARRR